MTKKLEFELSVSTRTISSSAVSNILSATMTIMDVEARERDSIVEDGDVDDFRVPSSPSSSMSDPADVSDTMMSMMDDGGDSDYGQGGYEDDDDNGNSSSRNNNSNNNGGKRRRIPQIIRDGGGVRGWTSAKRQNSAGVDSAVFLTGNNAAAAGDILADIQDSEESKMDIELAAAAAAAAASSSTAAVADELETDSLHLARERVPKKSRDLVALCYKQKKREKNRSRDGDGTDSDDDDDLEDCQEFGGDVNEGGGVQDFEIPLRD